MNNKAFQKSNLILLIMTCIILLLIIPNAVFAEVTTNELMPSDNQFLELRAVEIKEIEGQNKQVIMELWGNELEFKRI